MGVFSERPEDELQEWAGLPSEPRDRDGVEQLDAAPGLDPMSIGLGAQYASVVFPVAPPAPEADDTTDAAPGDD